MVGIFSHLKSTTYCHHWSFYNHILLIIIPDTEGWIKNSNGRQEQHIKCELNLKTPSSSYGGFDGDGGDGGDDCFKMVTLVFVKSITDTIPLRPELRDYEKMQFLGFAALNFDTIDSDENFPGGDSGDILDVQVGRSSLQLTGTQNLFWTTH